MMPIGMPILYYDHDTKAYEKTEVAPSNEEPCQDSLFHMNVSRPFVHVAQNREKDLFPEGK